MKTNSTLFLAILFSFQLIAQTNGLNYKAIVKDAAGDILVSTPIAVEFNILGSINQNLFYTEEHNAMTDANGLIVLIIGQGATSDIFGNIDWSRFEYFLNVRMDTGAGYVDLGTTQFEAVPYALHADTADIATLASTANTLKLISGPTTEFNVSYSSSGDKLRISETGVPGNVLEINSGELTLPQYAGPTDANLKIDVNGKLFKEVILPPGPQTTTFNKYEFKQKAIFPDYIKYYYGMQFEDGTVLTGIKSLILDNNSTGSNQTSNTAFVGIYRRPKIDNSQGVAGIKPIYRIDASDTTMDMFEEFTSTILATPGSNIIDNANYIYLVQIWQCDDCDVIEVSVLH